MHGIFGALSYNSNGRDILKDIVGTMSPPESKVLLSGRAGLGMKPLLKKQCESEYLPAVDDTAKISVVFDGVLFNKKDLLHKLSADGHPSAGNADQQVVLSCYRAYGEACFSLLDGMYAAAIYDGRIDSLILARDRAGSKPLFYHSGSGLFLFASDLDPILQTGQVLKRINTAALYQYLHLNGALPPLTIFEDIYMLEPGQYLTVDTGNECKLITYWDAVFDREQLISDYDTCKSLLRKTLTDSVASRMPAGKPVGVFLSGGIDSTVIAGIASGLSTDRIETFTIGFSEREFDESDRAEIASRAFNTHHHLYRLDHSDALAQASVLIENMSQPFANSSALPTYMVNKYASGYLDTVLTGDGSDQQFAGSNKYLVHYYVDRYNKIPRFLRKGIFEKIVRALPDDSSLSRKVRKVISSADMSAFDRRRNLMTQAFKEDELPHLLNRYNSAVNAFEDVRCKYDKYAGRIDELGQTLYLDLKAVTADDMAKMGGMSRLAGIEVRMPMTSRDMMELACRIPSGFKLKDKQTKYILKDAFSDMIPRELLTASKKGFGVPLAQWLRGPLRPDLERVLSPAFLREQGLFNADYVGQILSAHMSKKADRMGALWNLYVFQSWYRRHFS